MDDHDHRAIANRLDLFHQQEEAPGMVFWHPRGFALYRVIEDHIRARMAGVGFREIRTPQLMDRALWEASGHWEKFGGEMFVVPDDNRVYALKPMSCPGHIQVFNQRVRSFRDLPLRYCEFGACHRNEPSGALQGLARTRAFVQDDAHIFCTAEQVEDEVRRFSALLRRIYAELGFADVRVALATRPEQRAGSDALWDQAEGALGAAARAAGLDYEVEPGEGAFYGPKLGFYLAGRGGRAWQCGTIQLDFVLPERLGARYVDSAGGFARPVMLHQAVLGSLERFIAMLLEHCDGQLPLWLAPEQAVVASIGEEHADYARRVADDLAAQGLRVALDLRAERLGRKIVDARESGIPIMLAVGAREAAAGTVALRRRDGTQQVMAIADAARLMSAEAVPGPS
jgi:threonyl-tRNA synthetase